MSVRHILEIPTLGKRLGFADVETLLNVLRTELTELHGHSQSITKQKGDES